jgi:hypothetical protein
MAWMRRFAAGMVVLGALAGCKGGAGEACNSGGPLGPVYCDQGLTCNTADGYTCERPGSRNENQSCSSDDLCSTGLWCNVMRETCVPFIAAGDPCSDPSSCGPGLTCIHDLTTRSTICGQPPDGGVTDASVGAIVIGTLTLPGSPPQGAKGTVALFTTLPPTGMPVSEGGFTPSGSTSVNYQVVGAPAGTYFIVALVDNDLSAGGLSPTAGDYWGWLGGDAAGNPPAAANAVVPDSGTVRFDFSLVVR